MSYKKSIDKKGLYFYKSFQKVTNVNFFTFLAFINDSGYIKQ